MKKLLILVSVLALLCAGCSDAPAQEDDTLHILATTYPVYLFTTAVTEGVEGIEVSRLITEEVSCLHDYTLTVSDMKAIERADIIVMNGAGFENFMSDALAQTDAAVIDCSAGIRLLETCHSHDEHDHEGHGHEHDPHIWLDPVLANQMMATISTELSKSLYCDDLASHGEFHTAYLTAAQTLEMARQRWNTQLQPTTEWNLITFHDGFQYFADAFDLELLKSIEEEEGSTASAADIKEIVALIREYNIPAIFTEKNGSDTTARAIARETGVEIYQLDMLMSGDGQDISSYFDAVNANYAIIQEALS